MKCKCGKGEIPEKISEKLYLESSNMFRCPRCNKIYYYVKYGYKGRIEYKLRKEWGNYLSSAKKRKIGEDRFKQEYCLNLKGD